MLLRSCLCHGETLVYVAAAAGALQRLKKKQPPTIYFVAETAWWLSMLHGGMKQTNISNGAAFCITRHGEKMYNIACLCFLCRGRE